MFRYAAVDRASQRSLRVQVKTPGSRREAAASLLMTTDYNRRGARPCHFGGRFGTYFRAPRWVLIPLEDGEDGNKCDRNPRVVPCTTARVPTTRGLPQKDKIPDPSSEMGPVD